MDGVYFTTRSFIIYWLVRVRNVLEAAIFAAGLVLFVGGVNAVRPPADYSERPARLFGVGGRRSALSYVQTDGAVLGAVGLFAMLFATFL
jgi:hypothetical protein